MAHSRESNCSRIAADSSRNAADICSRYAAACHGAAFVPTRHETAAFVPEWREMLAGRVPGTAKQHAARAAAPAVPCSRAYKRGSSGVPSALLP